MTSVNERVYKLWPVGTIWPVISLLCRKPSIIYYIYGVNQERYNIKVSVSARSRFILPVPFKPDYIFILERMIRLK